MEYNKPGQLIPAQIQRIAIFQQLPDRHGPADN
jgi:hypothetical protein